MSNFNQIPTSICKRTDLTASDKLVYGYIYTFIAQGKEAFPSIPRIAEECGMSNRGVQKCIRHLEELCLLISQQRFNNSSIYTLGGEQNALPPEQNAPPPRTECTTPLNKVPPTISFTTSPTTSLLKEKEIEDDDSKASPATQDNVCATAQETTILSSASSLIGEYRVSGDEGSDTTSFNTLKQCINLAVAKCKEYGMKPDEGAIEHSLVSLGYYNVCEGYRVLDTIHYDAPF